MIFLFIFLIGFKALATPPLVFVTAIFDEDLQFWWKEGHFLTGNKEKQLGYNPMETTNPTALPVNLSQWTELPGKCMKDVSVTRKHQKKDYRALVMTMPEGLLIQLFDQDIKVAENSILHRVNVCSLHIVQADQLPGLEIIVIWHMGERGRGATIFHIPEHIQ